MFFLHHLDITLNDCLPEILKMDDADIYRSLKISPHQMRRVQLQDARNVPEVEVDGDQYLISLTPTWTQLEKAVENEPWSILKQWQWPEDLDEFTRPDADGNISMAIHLFLFFTSQIWAILHPVWKTPTADTKPFKPRNLQEALEFWTLNQLHKSLVCLTAMQCGPVWEYSGANNAPLQWDMEALYGSSCIVSNRCMLGYTLRTIWTNWIIPGCSQEALTHQSWQPLQHTWNIIFILSVSSMHQPEGSMGNRWQQGHIACKPNLLQDQCDQPIPIPALQVQVHITHGYLMKVTYMYLINALSRCLSGTL